MEKGPEAQTGNETPGTGASSEVMHSEVPCCLCSLLLPGLPTGSPSGTQKPLSAYFGSWQKDLRVESGIICSPLQLSSWVAAQRECTSGQSLLEVHTPTPTHTHPHRGTLIPRNTLTHIHTLTDTHTQEYSHTHRHTHIYAHSQVHTHSQEHTHIHTQEHSHTCTHTGTFTHRNAHTYS